MTYVEQQSAPHTSDERSRLEAFGIATGLFELHTVPPHTLVAENFELKLTSGQTTHAVGSFLLDLTATSIRVRHQGNSTRVLWESDPNRPFLAAARSIVDLKRLRDHADSFNVAGQAASLIDLESLDTLFITDERTATIVGTLSNPRQRRRCSFRFQALSENQLQFAVEILGADANEWNRLTLRCASAENEAFFGFGKQLNQVNHKGKLIPIFVQEHGSGHGRGKLRQLLDLFLAGARNAASVTDAPAPHFITSRMRSLFLEDKQCSVFDLRAAESLEITLFANCMTGRILFGRSPLDLIEEYTAYSGRMRRMPDWIHEGVMVAAHGGTGDVSALFDKLTAAKVPVSALWLRDWTGAKGNHAEQQVVWNWQLDRSHYPDWEALVDKLAQNQARICLYINPLLTSELGDSNHVKPGELYRQAHERGYLVKRDGALLTYRNSSAPAGMIDLSNPDAYAWMKELIKREVIETAKASGWMADLGEMLPPDAELSGTTKTEVWQNHYPEAWAQLNREAIQESVDYRDLIFWNRTGFTQSPEVSTLFCLGDQTQTWDEYDGIKAAVVGLLSSGVSGFSLSHSDTGGFLAVTLAGAPLIARSTELLMRWMELNAFTAVFRTHEGLIPSISAQVDTDEQTLGHLARFARVYKCLAPYRKSLVAEAASMGYPVVRPMFLQFPDDSLVFDLRYQFMLGSDFLIAPVLDKGAETVRVYLPAGKWTHVWTGREFLSAVGGWFDVAAPLGQPGVFYRSGAVSGELFVLSLMEAGVI